MMERKRVAFRDELLELAELVRGLPVKLDLIDVNDPTGRFRPPAAEELAAPVARRYSGGRDIHAACGMLAAGQSPESQGSAAGFCSSPQMPSMPKIARSANKSGAKTGAL
jgi:hypothetical protein